MMFYRSVRLGLLALVTSLGLTQAARADLQLALQEDTGPITLVATGTNFNPLSFSGTYGDFTVSILGGSSTNATPLSDLLSSTTSVMNNASAIHTLRLWVSQNNYTLPSGSPLSVESGEGGTVNIGTLGPLGIFQAFADKGNNPLFATNVIGSTIAAPGAATMDFTNGPQDDHELGSTFDTGSAVGSFTRTGNFSLTSVAKLTLTGGGDANYANHVNVTATPEPATAVLALTGLPIIGFVYWSRRRKRQS